MLLNSHKTHNSNLIQCEFFSRNYRIFEKNAVTGSHLLRHTSRANFDVSDNSLIVIHKLIVEMSNFPV